MAEYSQMVITALILLIFVNSIFLYAFQLPGGQHGEEFYSGLSDAEKIKIGYNAGSFLTQQNVITGQVEETDTSVNIASSQSGYIKLFLNQLFGSLNFVTGGTLGALVSGFSVVGVILGAIYNIFFGFDVWINWFLPSSIPGILFLKLPLEGFFFFIVAYGLYVFLSTLFGLGTGARS